MTAFAVYGVLFSECEKDARKKTPTEIRKGDKVIELTEKEWLEEVKIKAEQSFKRNKPKKISVLFDAPQFCHDFIKLCKNVRSKEVHIRRAERVTSLRKGKPVEKIIWKPMEA